MSDNGKLIIIAVTCICIGMASCAYLFTSIGTGRTSLSDKQVQSLCEDFAGDLVIEEGDRTDSTFQAAVKIFGVKGKGNKRTIYGYVSGGVFNRLHDKAYIIGGSSGEFMADVRIHGEAVEIIKSYGYDSDSLSAYDAMPFRYKFKISEYSKNGSSDLEKELNAKVEKALGVPVDTRHILFTMKKRYELYYLDDNGKLSLEEKGRIDQLK